MPIAERNDARPRLAKAGRYAGRRRFGGTRFRQDGQTPRTCPETSVRTLARAIETSLRWTAALRHSDENRVCACPGKEPLAGVNHGPIGWPENQMGWCELIAPAHCHV